MRTLAGTQVQDDFLKTMFIKRLPLSVRSILASNNDSLDNLALMAHKISEFSSPNAHTFENSDRRTKFLSCKPGRSTYIHYFFSRQIVPTIKSTIQNTRQEKVVLVPFKIC